MAEDDYDLTAAMVLVNLTRCESPDDMAEIIAVALRGQAQEERIACADIADQHASIEGIAQKIASEIRARNSTGGGTGE